MKIEIRYGAELCKEDKLKIESFFRAKYPACIFEYIKDEKIIGGFTAKCGDKVFDASVKFQLDVLEKMLIGT